MARQMRTNPSSTACLPSPYYLIMTMVIPAPGPKTNESLMTSQLSKSRTCCTDHDWFPSSVISCNAWWTSSCWLISARHSVPPVQHDEVICSSSLVLGKEDSCAADLEAAT